MVYLFSIKKHVINFIVEQVASIKYKTQMNIVNVVDILPFFQPCLKINHRTIWICTVHIRIAYVLLLLSVDIDVLVDSDVLVRLHKLSIFCCELTAFFVRFGI